jgi:hypothetical protein
MQLTEGTQARERNLAESIARRFHEKYEYLAWQFAYETRPASAVPWHQVPQNNRDLMIATANEAVMPLVRALNLEQYRPFHAPGVDCPICHVDTGDEAHFVGCAIAELLGFSTQRRESEPEDCVNPPKQLIRAMCAAFDGNNWERYNASLYVSMERAYEVTRAALAAPEDGEGKDDPPCVRCQRPISAHSPDELSACFAAACDDPEGDAVVVRLGPESVAQEPDEAVQLTERLVAMLKRDEDGPASTDEGDRPDPISVVREALDRARGEAIQGAINATGRSALRVMLEAHLVSHGFFRHWVGDREYWGHAELGQGRTFTSAVAWQMGREDAEALGGGSVFSGWENKGQGFPVIDPRVLA